MTQTTATPTVETVRAKAAQYNNWGAWGPDDQLGSLNYVTPEKIAVAARLARTGKVFSLALPLDDSGPQTGSLGRYNPLHHMIWDGGDIAAGAQSAAEAHGVEVGEGDFVLVRTGQIAQRRSLGSWGDYAGGPAPGLGVSAADFSCQRKVATASTDTWGTPVNPQAVK